MPCHSWVELSKILIEGQILGIVAYVALIAYLWLDSLRAKKL